MKKIFSRILAVGLLSAGIIGVSSCDYLDQKPENLKTTDMIWETRVEAEAYLYNIYGIFGCLLMIRLCSVLLMKPPVSFLIRMSVIW